MCSDLHMLYLLVPPGEQLEMDWNVFEEWYRTTYYRDNVDECHVLRKVLPKDTLVDHFLNNMVRKHNQVRYEKDVLVKVNTMKKLFSDEELLKLFCTCARLHSARALQLLVEETTEDKVVQALWKGKVGSEKLQRALKVCLLYLLVHLQLPCICS